MKMSIKITDALDTNDDADDLEGVIEVIVDDIICDVQAVNIDLKRTDDGITFNVVVFDNPDYRADLTNDEIDAITTVLDENFSDFRIEITLS